MASIFSPARWFRKLSPLNRQARTGPISRRHRQERLHFAVADMLESRLMLTAALHMCYASEPADTTAGTAPSPPSPSTLKMEATPSSPPGHFIVSLSVVTGPGGARKLFSVLSNNGVASFGGLSFTVAGNYTLSVASFGSPPLIPILSTSTPPRRRSW